MGYSKNNCDSGHSSQGRKRAKVVCNAHDSFDMRQPWQWLPDYRPVRQWRRCSIVCRRLSPQRLVGCRGNVTERICRNPSGAFEGPSLTDFLPVAAEVGRPSPPTGPARAITALRRGPRATERQRKPRRTAGIAGRTRRRGGRGAARGARAAASDAGGLVSQRRRAPCAPAGSVQTEPGRSRPSGTRAIGGASLGSN